MKNQINPRTHTFTTPFLEDELPYEINLGLKEINCELRGAWAFTQDSDTTTWYLFIEFDPKVSIQELHETVLESFQDGDAKINHSTIKPSENLYGMEIIYKS